MRNYKITTDINVTAVSDGETGYLIDPDDVVRVLHPTDTDLLDGTGEKEWHPEVIQATPEEVAGWEKEFAALADGMTEAAERVEEARSAYESAVEEARKGAQRAWENYRVVHETIWDRIKEVEALREEDQATKAKALQQAADAALAAEDAELGPRTFYVTRRSQRGQDGPTMDAPVVHHVDCETAKRLSRLPDPVRIEEAFDALMEGGMGAVKILHVYTPTPDAPRVTGMACEKCKAFALLRAHAPEIFDAWLKEVESAQRATMPPQTHNGDITLFKRLGLERVPPGVPVKKPGWSRINDRYYREHNNMADDEVLIGWVEPGKLSSERVVASDTDRLKTLFDLLPSRGFEVRWIHEPDQDEVSPYSVAIRPMTKWAIRSLKETK